MLPLASMPELPEVETVCRVMRRALVGARIARVEVARDALVFSGHPPRAIERALVGRVVDAIGRRGKYFWITLRGEGPAVLGHLGMSGWVREIGGRGTRLLGHGDAPFEDDAGRPRFLRLLLETEDGRRVAFTDPRRLGRIWLAGSAEEDARIARLGPDAYDELPPIGALRDALRRRKRPIKAVLLDQAVFAGVGNWIADEVLYQARVAPARLASSLTEREVAALRRALRSVLDHAVKVGADHRRFPRSWLFEHRWGGARGAARVGGHAIVREVIGGRTTAWVPSRQR
jgi:formamidopyrimidine-DNA glycosylase